MGNSTGINRQKTHPSFLPPVSTDLHAALKCACAPSLGGHDVGRYRKKMASPEGHMQTVALTRERPEQPIQRAGPGPLKKALHALISFLVFVLTRQLL